MVMCQWCVEVSDGVGGQWRGPSQESYANEVVRFQTMIVQVTLKGKDVQETLKNTKLWHFGTKWDNMQNKAEGFRSLGCSEALSEIRKIMVQLAEINKYSGDLILEERW